MTHFPNLARRDPSEEEIAVITEICRSELEAAGIETHTFGTLLSPSEVPSKCIGGLAGWTFKRAWYYWTASGPGLPPDYAERLHATHGKEVRVEGHCGCPSPSDWAKGFAIGSYHIDTGEGLKALADTLRSVAPQPLQGGEVTREQVARIISRRSTWGAYIYAFDPNHPTGTDGEMAEELCVIADSILALLSAGRGEEGVRDA